MTARLRWAALQHIRALPQLRATVAYGQLMAEQGGCRRDTGRAVGILSGEEIHLCVVRQRRLEGNA